MPKECLNSTEQATKNTGKTMEWDNLHELLRSLYDDMMPLAGEMAAVARVWRDWEHCSMCGIR